MNHIVLFMIVVVVVVVVVVEVVSSKMTSSCKCIVGQAILPVVHNETRVRDRILSQNTY